MDAHRLVVDESTGASVGELHATKDQFIFNRDSVGCENGPRRMIACNLERRSNLTLLNTLPHQRLVTAPAQGQSKGIEQDRFAGAGLAGQHGKLVGEVNVEPVDQNDVADRESGEHGLTVLDDHARPAAGRAVLRFRIFKDDDGRDKPGQDDVGKSCPWSLTQPDAFEGLADPGTLIFLRLDTAGFHQRVSMLVP